MVSAIQPRSSPCCGKEADGTCSCEICRAILPEEAAITAELQDDVVYFCSPECYTAWQGQVSAGNETSASSDFPLSVSQLANAAQTTVHVVRSYLAEGLIECSKRTAAGYGLFDQCALNRLKLIRLARDAGLMLLDIKPLVMALNAGEADAAREAGAELRHRIAEKQAFLHELDEWLGVLGRPD